MATDSRLVDVPEDLALEAQKLIASVGLPAASRFYQVSPRALLGAIARRKTMAGTLALMERASARRKAA